MAGVKGRSGGKREGQGRPPKAVELKLLERMAKTLGDDWEDVILLKALEMAKAGSYPHQTLLLAYKYGKPQDKVDITSKGESIGGHEVVFKDYTNGK